MAHTSSPMQTVRKDVKSILHDTQVLKEDTFSLVRDVEHLERVVTSHWKELLLDFLCALCCCSIDVHDAPTEEIRSTPYQSVSSEW